MSQAFPVLLIAAPMRRHEAEEAIRLAGGTTMFAIDWTETTGLLDRPIDHAVLVLEAEGVADDLLAAALADVRTTAEALDLSVVATLTRTQIDMVAGSLLDLRLQALCEVSFVEWVGALAVAGRQGHGGGLYDRWREGADRPDVLDEEVARIAELLARLGKRERGGGAAQSDMVADTRSIAFGFAPPVEDIDPQSIRQAIRGRRLRESFFGNDLFGDPAWDMLLDLYAAHLEGVQVSVSSLCIAAAVAPTTALRWITRLTQTGVFERQPDRADRRRAFLALSAQALNGMNSYVAAMRRAGLPFA